MNCTYCREANSKVIDSRLSEDGHSIRRRRECAVCGRRFTTYERAGEVKLFVIKKDGRRETFDRQKILSGITKACEKRPIGRELIESWVDEIEDQTRDMLSNEIPGQAIGEMVMQRLRATDPVAYVRFASVYKEFRDADSFLEEIEQLTIDEHSLQPNSNSTPSS